jgi:hypothetical protein
MFRKRSYPITPDDLNILDCLEKRVILQVPFRLVDKLVAAGLIEIAMMPPDRISARGSALLREQRDAQAQASIAAGLATRGDTATQRLRPNPGARRRA